MYWADKLAEEIIRRKPDKEEYVCAAGISPSGSVHIGNFRDIATSYFVYRALLRKGKKGESFSFRGTNSTVCGRCRKTFPTISADNSYEKYIGYPYVGYSRPVRQG